MAVMQADVVFCMLRAFVPLDVCRSVVCPEPCLEVSILSQFCVPCLRHHRIVTTFETPHDVPCPSWKLLPLRQAHTGVSAGSALPERRLTFTRSHGASCSMLHLHPLAACDNL